jgi:hypothetical protein
VVDESGNLLYEYDAAYVDNKYETFELRVIHRRRHTGFEDSKEFPIRKNDLIAGRYQVRVWCVLRCAFLLLPAISRSGIIVLWFALSTSVTCCCRR